MGNTLGLHLAQLVTLLELVSRLTVSFRDSLGLDAICYRLQSAERRENVWRSLQHFPGGCLAASVCCLLFLLALWSLLEAYGRADGQTPRRSYLPRPKNDEEADEERQR